MTGDVTARLDAIEQRANAATKGPWAVEYESCGCLDCTDSVMPTSHPKIPWGFGPFTYTETDVDGADHAAAIEFAAAAREDLPWLIELVERVRELHKPETRYTTDGTWSDDDPDEAAAYAEVEVAGLTTFEICTHCGRIEMRQAGDVGDYLDALWPCPTVRALDGEEKPPVAKPCKGCGCALADHHKLHCENEHCPGCYGGWTCTEHGWVLCGCTYAGGVDPATGEYAS